MINDENPLPAVCFIKKTKGDRFMNKKIMYIITILSTAVLLFLDQIAPAIISTATMRIGVNLFVSGIL